MDAPVVTVRAPDGSALAELRVRGGAVSVDPPEAEAHPLVAAVAARMRESVRRPRPRPSC